MTQFVETKIQQTGPPFSTNWILQTGSIPTQIGEGGLDNALKQSQTSNKSSDPLGIHPLVSSCCNFQKTCLKLFHLRLHPGTNIWNLGQIM